MQPAEIAESYDSIAHQWLEPFLETNGIHQHEHALLFRPPGGMALDVDSGCSGRFIRLLEKNGYQVEGLDLSPQMIALTKTRNPNVRFHHAELHDQDTTRPPPSTRPLVEPSPLASLVLPSMPYIKEEALVPPETSGNAVMLGDVGDPSKAGLQGAATE